MREVKDETLIMTFKEISILLYNLGFRRVKGIMMDQTEFTDSEILSSLLELSKRNIIRTEGESFSIRPDVKRALEIMGEPSADFAFRPGGGEPTYYCYVVPGEVVVTELYRRRSENIRLRWFDTVSFAQWKEAMENDHH